MLLRFFQYIIQYIIKKQNVNSFSNGKFLPKTNIR